MASRKLDDLNTVFRGLAVEFKNACDLAELDILIYCTLRSNKEQARLYRNGRSYQTIRRKHDILAKLGRDDLAGILFDVGPQHGKSRLTNAGPGQSLHNYGFAFDGVPMRSGKPVWGNRSKQDRICWSQYGDIAESVGLEWSGRWGRFKEMPHCEMPGVDWRGLI